MSKKHKSNDPEMVKVREARAKEYARLQRQSELKRNAPLAPSRSRTGINDYSDAGCKKLWTAMFG